MGSVGGWGAQARDVLRAELGVPDRYREMLANYYSGTCKYRYRTRLGLLKSADFRISQFSDFPKLLPEIRTESPDFAER